MRWSCCGCDVRFLVRLDRRLWMRAVPGRRHYFCARCKAHQFLSRLDVRNALPADAPPELCAADTAPQDPQI
jgi:hypothetical protein